VTTLETRCRFHPGRSGIGVCTRCSATLCEECATRVEGILHCRDCLARLRSAPAAAGWRSASAVLPALALAPLVWVILGFGFHGVAAGIALVREWARTGAGR
jgi:hypothetical protein